MTNFHRQVRIRKWLEHDLHARIEPALMDDGVSGIAGRVEDLEPRLPAQSLVGELGTLFMRPGSPTSVKRRLTSRFEYKSLSAVAPSGALNTEYPRSLITSTE